MSQNKGRLTIAGCGLHPGHMTLETINLIKSADKVLVVCPNPLSIAQIMELNQNAENLGRFYDMGYSRPQIYREISKYIVEVVTQGFDVCVIFYGHPGVFVTSTRTATQVLKNEGYDVKMLPGISADACLYAELDLDPADTGCQSYECSRFLLTEREVDNSAALILWQLGLTGEHSLEKFEPGKHGLEALTKLLLQSYDKSHKVCLYETSTLPGFEPRTDWVPLSELPKQSVNEITTLFVPACKSPSFAQNRLSWLGLDSQDIEHWQDVEKADV